MFGASPTAAAKDGSEAAQISKEAEMELLEQEKIEDVVSGWERKLTRHADDFKRYGRAIAEMDSTLFEYVEKLLTIQNQQDRLEERQKDVISVIDKVELRQKVMLDTISRMEKKVLDRLPEGRKPHVLEARAAALNHQIVDLESQVLELTTDLDKLQTQTHPDGLGQLLFLTNNHCKSIKRANAQAEQINRWLSSPHKPDG